MTNEPADAERPAEPLNYAGPRANAGAAASREDRWAGRLALVAVALLLVGLAIGSVPTGSHRPHPLETLVR